jgi:hypothetical protein
LIKDYEFMLSLNSEDEAEADCSLEAGFFEDFYLFL